MTIALKNNITIHPVVEQARCTDFRAMEFFPALDQGAVRGEPLLAGAGFHRSVQ